MSIMIWLFTLGLFSN